MLLRTCLVLLIFFIGSSFVDIKLKKTKINDFITVSIPENFFHMTPGDISKRYPSVRKPIAAFTNEQMLVDFSINQSATMWRPRDVEMAKSFIKSSIMNMFDEVKFLQEDIREINDKKYIVFEIESRVEGDKNSVGNTGGVAKYSYLQYLLINGKMIVFSLHTPIQLKEKWQPVAPRIMESVKVSKKI